MTTPIPYARPFALDTLSGRGAEVSIEPRAGERAKIAEWLGVMAVETLAATVRITRLGEARYRYEAHFTADVVQACVVTLEPVPSHLAAEFSREYRVEERSRPRRLPLAGSQTPSNLDEDEPELLPNPVLDLAAPVLEELSLALDPYPRAPGASFEAKPQVDLPPESPFAVLSALKPKAARARKGAGKGDKKPRKGPGIGSAKA
jgi:uncharacterized metal-binding protein YceD (DUF177 family)